MDSPAKLATEGTQDEKSHKKTLQHNICWKPIYASQHT